MIKNYCFDLNQTYFDKFFIPVRNKNHIIEILMNTLKYIILNPDVKKEDSVGHIELYIDKTSRVYYFDKEKNKYFSLIFPFTIKEEDGIFSFSFDCIEEIDSKLTSDIIKLIKCESSNSECVMDFFEPIYDYQVEENQYIWLFLKKMLIMEDGYIRYDYDPENYKKYKEKGEELKHPEYHYDIFYSSNCSIKIGLDKEIEYLEFIELTDPRKNSRFLRC